MNRNTTTPILLSVYGLLAAFAVLFGAVRAATSQPLPTALGGFVIHVIDRDVDADFELVTQDTGFTPLSAQATISVIYAAGTTAGNRVNPDTANVWVTGIERNNGSDSLRYYKNSKKVAGGDTVTVGTGDTLISFESAWMDTSKARPLLVFSDATSVRGSILDTIAANSLWSPKAHVFFGRGQQGVIEHIDAQKMAGPAVTCEFRVWQRVLQRAVNYSTGYVVAAAADSTTMASGLYAQDWGGEGLEMPEESYCAWLCKGSAANTDVAVTIVGRRRR